MFVCLCVCVCVFVGIQSDNNVALGLKTEIQNNFFNTEDPIEGIKKTWAYTYVSDLQNVDTLTRKVTDISS